MPGPRDRSMDMGVGRESESGQPSGASQPNPLNQIVADTEVPPKPPTAAQERLAMLSRAIEDQVIPRLILARRAGVLLEASGSLQGWMPAYEDVADLARLAIGRDPSLAGARLRALHERGVPLEILYTELLGPAARHLGVQWEDDQIGFTEVTAGTWRLRQALQDLSAEFLAEVEARERARRVLLVPAIGEQHSFGVMIVAEFFRKAGWDVRCEMVGADSELERMVQAEWFDAIGLSVGAFERLPVARKSIATARKASRNLNLAVLVGGPVFVAHPEYVAEVGADGTAADPARATALAEHLISARAAETTLRPRQAGPG